MSRVLGIAVIAAAVVISTAHANAGEDTDTGIELPTPTGKFAVGTLSLPMVDDSREGVYDDGTTTRGREMMVQFWYPAARRANGPKSEYMDELTFLYAFEEDAEEAPDLRLLIQTHAIVGAKMPSGSDRFPVLLFSPGLGLFYSHYQSLFEDLASRGYIVAAVNSPNVAGITVFPDGHARLGGEPSTGDFDALVEMKFRTVTDDLKFVARQLPELDRSGRLPISGRIKFWEIGCFGHSLGGTAAVQACIETPAMVGAINIDGRFFGSGYKSPITKPMMLILAENRPADRTVEIFWSNLLRSGFRVKLAQSGHLSFIDIPFLLAELGVDPSLNPDFGGIEPTRCIQITRDAVRGFFDTVLYNKDAAKLERLLKKNSDVLVARRNAHR